jgi:hypothetical protein
MVRLTGIIGLIGFLQLIVFGLQARRLKYTIEKMDEIATGQTADMQASIGQTARTAVAMEGVAEALATSAATGERIANRQEMVSELQTRAYVAVNYVGIVPQNNDTMYRFEPRFALTGSGLTPAYNLSYISACDVLPHPIPQDFPFPLPESLNPSVGMLGPRNNFTVSAVAPKMYSDIEIAEMKAGTTRRLHVWGMVTYEDAFKIPRFLRFGCSIVWMADGTNTTTFNTERLNDAN